MMNQLFIHIVLQPSQNHVFVHVTPDFCLMMIQRSVHLKVWSGFS